jgi:cell division protein FtsL
MKVFERILQIIVILGAISIVTFFGRMIIYQYRHEIQTLKAGCQQQGKELRPEAGLGGIHYVCK